MLTRRTFAKAGLVLVPLSWAAERLHWGESVVFVCSGLAILPLAIWLSMATEKLSVALGPSLGALLNAVFGNASELIIALLALGLSMFLGGLGRSEQRFQPVVARVNGSAMTLAVLAILIPSLAVFSTGAAPERTQAFSGFVAWVLLLVYGLTLIFSLRTHRALYEVAEAECRDGEAAVSPLPWLLVLIGATTALALVSEIFVGVVESVTSQLGLTALFTGVVLLPLLGGAAEFLTAITMARRNQMDLAVSVAMGSTLLVALLVVPVLVLASPLLGHPLDLSFEIYELVAVITAVLVSNLVSLDGRSDWLEGVLLLAAYVILAAGLYFQAL
ncbi:calcium/proton exchanger [Synechococcus sp. CS-1329]|uniref:calcium/proton exchanger n=1 Tax=Synechococcus sp. CS-1329 TaxID=2847975 RepID=UPI0037D9A302|nr:calcium/proton exchanger [Synechococcus sp. CS-1329]